MATIDPVLTQFRSALNEVYGDRIERVVLFGSRARGDAQPDSDYDVAVFLKGMEDRWAEFDRLSLVETSIIEKTGAVVHAMPYLAGAYRERTPLTHELRREGLDLRLPRQSVSLRRPESASAMPAPFWRSALATRRDAAHIWPASMPPKPSFSRPPARSRKPTAGFNHSSSISRETIRACRPIFCRSFHRHADTGGQAITRLQTTALNRKR